ncbi:MAG: hypothetical protein KME14_26475 [Tildeniella torsiva UHER 1998/13D]|jgi:hypothetical protein|nr:hypothetical protein [Tildeniella torsiva UHER 1998/13D]
MSKQQDVIAELLKSLREKDSETTEEEQSYGEEHLVRLREACDRLCENEDFEVGQIVKWKKDLKNRRLPRQNQPAIVVKVLDEPIVSSDDESGSPYFLEKLDIILGVMSKDGTFLTFYYDSSRFESY